MKPETMGERSFSALAMGARQFVVQEAAEMIVSDGLSVLWLTLKTIVGRSLPAGAEMTTLRAPALT